MGQTLPKWKTLGDTERVLRRAFTQHGRIDLLCSREKAGGRWQIFEIHAYYDGEYGVSLHGSHVGARNEFYRLLRGMVKYEGLRRPVKVWVRKGQGK